MELYRIISLETFIDLLHHKRERYVRPSTWEDVFEGYLFSVRPAKGMMFSRWNSCPIRY